jgi:hypothetical protein
MVFRFNLLSDLHLECVRGENAYDTFQFPGTAPVLLLGGDIGYIRDSGYARFLARACTHYEEVVFVLGNHCAYSTDWESAVAIATMIADSLPNLTFLNNGEHEIGGGEAVIVGGTLHSHIPHERAAAITWKVADFRQICGWSVARHNHKHAEAVDFLRRYDFGAQPEKKRIGLFHYPCLDRGVSAPHFEEDTERDLNSAFATNLIDEVWFQRFNTICFGHGHYNNEFTADGVRFISNQRGYPDEDVAGFDPARVYQV